MLLTTVTKFKMNWASPPGAGAKVHSTARLSPVFRRSAECMLFNYFTIYFYFFKKTSMNVISFIFWLLIEEVWSKCLRQRHYVHRRWKHLLYRIQLGRSNWNVFSTSATSPSLCSQASRENPISATDSSIHFFIAHGIKWNLIKGNINNKFQKFNCSLKKHFKSNGRHSSSCWWLADWLVMVLL